MKHIEPMYFQMILAGLRRSCIDILQGASLPKGLRVGKNAIKATLNAVNTRFRADPFHSCQAHFHGSIQPIKAPYSERYPCDGYSQSFSHTGGAWLGNCQDSEDSIFMAWDLIEAFDRVLCLRVLPSAVLRRICRKTHTYQGFLIINQLIMRKMKMI